MNWDTAAGNWKEIRGKVKEKWGKLTDDDLTFIDGKREQLLGRLQQRYGLAKDKAERDIKTWEQSLN
ncbi:MAG TPA: CsbD family protein [Candidatus Sulfotelmatobacter sp.]|nr:CsbD family protein [Candidatus Sulfotelmatobacter sp.]